MLFLDFENTIATLEAELAELRHSHVADGPDLKESEAALQARIQRQLESIYSRLTPWQSIQVARHPERPCAREIIHNICSQFIELHGDRDGGDALLTTGGIARILDHSVVVIGHDRPRSQTNKQASPKTSEKSEASASELACGLKKTARLLSLAERFRLPVVLIADGEPRAAHDIALPLHHCMDTALNLRVPIISIITGALSGPSTALLMSADAVLMLSHAVLSHISPEDSAAALWPDSQGKQPDLDKAAIATAESLGLVANDLLEHQVIDSIIPEPLGGAHRNTQRACQDIGACILARLESLRHVEGGFLRAKRRDRLTTFGRTHTTT